MYYFGNCSEKAIRETGDQNIEAAMDWLISHSENAEEQQPTENKQSKVEEPAIADEAPNSDAASPATVAKSIKCDE